MQQRFAEAEACLGRHDSGLTQLDVVVRGLSTARQSGPAQPGFGAEFGADFATGAASGNGTSRTAQAEEFEVHSNHETRRQGPWKLYDEKFLLDAKNVSNPNDQATWLEDLQDELSGRTPELDGFFSWAEVQ